MNWLLPYAVGAAALPAPVTTGATAASSDERDCPSSPAFSAGGAIKGAGSGSSPSAASSSSRSGNFNFSTSRRHSPSTSPLCFGAGGAGILLWSSSKALSPASKNPKEEASASQAAPKGDVVGRFLRRISRRLRMARAAKEPPPPRGAVDDTARVRAEDVAIAVAYCKETLRRGTSPPPPPPPPLSSPSLDCWLHDMQEEIIAGAAAHREECRDSQAPPPRPRREGARHYMEYSLRQPSAPSTAAAQSPHHGHLAGDSKFPEQITHARHAPRMRLPCVHGARVPAAAAAETGKPSHPRDAAAGEMETRDGFTEQEFLKTFNGDEELINRHFITVQI